MVWGAGNRRKSEKPAEHGGGRTGVNRYGLKRRQPAGRPLSDDGATFRVGPKAAPAAERHMGCPL